MEDLLHTMDKEGVLRISHIRTHDFPLTARADKLVTYMNAFHLMLLTDHTYRALCLFFHLPTLLSFPKYNRALNTVSIYYVSKTTEINSQDTKLFGMTLYILMKKQRDW
jgi:hypothetical protein